MGVFDRYKRFAGFQDDSLRERGIRGTATVLSARDTGMSSGGRGEASDMAYEPGSPIYELRLSVTLPGTAPYEVEHRAAGVMVAAGQECVVYVDPDDHDKVFVDDEGSAAAQTADALSQFTGQPVGADWDSIQKAVAGMQEQATQFQAQWQQQIDAAYAEQMKAMPGAGGPGAPAPPAGTDRIAALERLARLKDSGALSEEEFEAEKARLLEGG